MKILIIRNFPNYMEVKDACYNIQEVGLAKALVRCGNQCDIVFWIDKEERTQEIKVGESKTIKIFYRKGVNILKNCWYRDIDNLIFQYDVIQPCEYNQIQSVYFAKKYPEKTVIYHGSYYAEFNKRFNMLCSVFDLIFLHEYIKRGTKFMVKSQLAKDFLVSKGIGESNVTVVGVGIDGDALTSDSSGNTEYICKKIKENRDDTKILYVGKFEPRRNVLFIIEIFSEIYKKNSNVKLYLIGSGKEDYLQDVRKAIKDNKLEEAIVWQDKLQQKYMSIVYQEADIFLLPTEYEIFGMVLLEAMYYETAVITTRNGGSSTVICNGENGIIIDEICKVKWIEAILNLISDVQNLNNIKKKASDSIKQGYTWDMLSDKFVIEYNKTQGRLT